MNPIIQLEATNGLLSQCFRSVEAAAKVRIEKAMERLTSKRQKDTRESRANNSKGAPETDQADAESHCKREKDLVTQAAENAQRARDVLDFLTDHGALRRMIRLRILMEPTRILKRAILGRSGRSWEQQHMASVIQAAPAENQVSSTTAPVNVESHSTSKQSPLRLRYPVCCSALGEDVEEALRGLTGLMMQPSRAGGACWGARRRASLV